MRGPLVRSIGAILGAVAIFVSAIGVARAGQEVPEGQAPGEQGYWRATFSPAATHFRYSPEHRHVWALGIERQWSDDWLAGFAYFRNSFGQPSAYAYVGRRFPRLSERWPGLFFQASAGVIYGYKGKYKDKLALNLNGFAPGALVGLGWQFDDRSALAVHLLGDAGLMLQFSRDFR
jgi:hypothetical protein